MSLKNKMPRIFAINWNGYLELHGKMEMILIASNSQMSDQEFRRIMASMAEATIVQLEKQYPRYAKDEIALKKERASKRKK